MTVSLASDMTHIPVTVYSSTSRAVAYSTIEIPAWADTSVVVMEIATIPTIMHSEV